MRAIAFWLMAGIVLHAQISGPHRKIFSASVTPISVEATCSGTGSTQTVACSSAMTVTAGDTIECAGSTQEGDPMTLYFNDPVNGKTYDNIWGGLESNVADTWVATAVFQNSAGGSITPYVNNWEGPNVLSIKCRALKGTRTTLVLDTGAVNQTKQQTTAATNPTSGTAAAPTNNNEIVLGAMVRAATATVSDASPWTPGSTITAVGGTYPIYDHYSIQTTAATANSPMTASSSKYVDTQFAVLNASNPAGTRGVTGFYGVPAIAKTNGNSATAADLNGTTTTLATINANATWVLSGTAGTYDTSVAPFGTGPIMAQGINHTFGDAATSIQMSGAQTANYYTWTAELADTGAPAWFSSFFRVGSSGTSSGQSCDSFEMETYGATEDAFFVQALYDTTNGLQLFMEPAEGGHSPLIQGLSLGTDYRLQIHTAGSGERYHQLIVQSKSGSTWSVAQTMNLDVLCTVGGPIACTTPPVVGSGTGSASSGSTSLTITSGSGTIAAGQVVVPQTGIPYLTAVESISGTCSSSCTITLSQPTTGVISGTVAFTTKPARLVAATNGTVSAGSTAVTIVVPGNGTIAVGNNVGGPGIMDGTYVTAVSGTSLTLSHGASSAITNGGLWFWTGASGGANFIAVHFGKWSTCNIGGSEWFSGMHFDPLGAWGAYAPN